MLFVPKLATGGGKSGAESIPNPTINPLTSPLTVLLLRSDPLSWCGWPNPTVFSLVSSLFLNDPGSHRGVMYSDADTPLPTTLYSQSAVYTQNSLPFCSGLSPRATPEKYAKSADPPIPTSACKLAALMGSTTVCCLWADAQLGVGSRVRPYVFRFLPQHATSAPRPEIRTVPHPLTPFRPLPRTLT